MEAGSKRPRWGDNDISALNAAIDALNLAKELPGITPVKAGFDSASVILATIRVSLLLVFR